MNRLFLLDGSHLAYRSYFAFIRNPLRTSAGENTSALFGFINSLFKILKDENPDYIAVAFDRPEPTFRHSLYQEYKATRDQMPDDLVSQIQPIKDVIHSFNIPLLEKPGFEADDIMATIAVKAANEGIDVCLVTGDKDMAQLVTGSVKLYRPQKGGEIAEIMGPVEVEEKFGVKPSQIGDFLALMGDSSDNVPGVRGIGEKKAVGLLRQFGTLDEVLGHPEKIASKSDRAKIEAGIESARLSRKLVELDSHVPLPVSIEELRAKKPDIARLRTLFQSYEFSSFITVLGDSMAQEKEDSVLKDREEQQYRAVLSLSGLDELCTTLRTASEGFSFDLETTSPDPMMAEIVGYSFSILEKEAFYVPVQCPETDKIEFSGDEAKNKLRELLENPGLRKFGQNAKYDTLVLRNAGVHVRGVEFDTMVAAYTINPGSRQYGIDALSLEYFDYTKIPTSQLIGSGKKTSSMAEVPLEDICRYACEDADFTFRLSRVLRKNLDDSGLADLYRSVELPLIPVLEEMEYNGVTIDREILKKMSGELEGDIRTLQAEIFTEAGGEFNINSPQQLGIVLFEKLEVHKVAGKKRVRKTKTGYATDFAFLEQLAPGNPIIKKILAFRQLTKLKSTYVDALPELINPRTGRIHTSFNQTIAATGRLSSSNPNLQNIPVRTERSREIRKAFIPRTSDWVILSADYSQIELRLAAHFSGDRTLINAFRNDEDIHRTTAALIFRRNPEEVTPAMRYQAKAINFGIIYGMGPDRLAREVEISREAAREFIDAYFITYPGVKRYIDSQLAEAHRNGYVTTLFGRKRYLPELENDNQQIRRAAENAAINTPVQGTAADIIKVAMINIFNEINIQKLPAKMILQIHDELVFELPAGEAESFRSIVIEKMENAVALKVPIKVDTGIGNNWFEAH